MWRVFDMGKNMPSDLLQSMFWGNTRHLSQAGRKGAQVAKANRALAKRRRTDEETLALVRLDICLEEAEDLASLDARISSGEIPDLNPCSIGDLVKFERQVRGVLWENIGDVVDLELDYFTLDPETKARLRAQILSYLGTQGSSVARRHPHLAVPSQRSKPHPRTVFSNPKVACKPHRRGIRDERQLPLL